MEIFWLILATVVCVGAILGISGICSTPNNKSNYSNMDNQNIPHSNKTARQRTVAELIEKQNAIKNLTIFNTILLIVLIAIVVFVIVKIYPYLDTLKEYYEMLDTLINYPLNGSYY